MQLFNLNKDSLRVIWMPRSLQRPTAGWMAPLAFPLCEESRGRRAVQLVNKSMRMAAHEGKEVEDTKSPERRWRQSSEKMKDGKIYAKTESFIGHVVWMVSCASTDSASVR